MESPTFKHLLHQDIYNVFFNFDEFAEKHDVNGYMIPALIDEMENIEREKKMKSHMDGIHARQILLYVPACEMDGLPAQGKLLTLDGRRYIVVDSVDEGGVYSITLEANRSR